MKKKVINVLVYVIIFSIGAIANELFDWGYFELSKEIKIIEALTLFATLGVGIYITKSLEKEVHDNRTEKDLYLTKISEIELTLDRIEEIVEEKNCSYNKINNRIHSCRKIKNAIFKSINENFTKKKATRLNGFESEITTDLNSLKRLLTETPIAQSGKPEITLKGGLANYTLERILEIDQSINSVKDKLFRLKVTINSL